MTSPSINPNEGDMTSPARSQLANNSGDMTSPTLFPFDISWRKWIVRSDMTSPTWNPLSQEVRNSDYMIKHFCLTKTP